MALLELKDITKFYDVEKGIFSRHSSPKIRAVEAVNLSLVPAKTMGLVGESGCGKSTLAKLIVKLIAPTSGDIFFENKNITQLREKEFRPLRKKIQIVFQDPYSSLSPRLKIENIIAEPLKAFKTERKKMASRIRELMEQVGLDEMYLARFPHQLSGGQRQRVGIARALATSAQLIVLDEAVSSLDLSTQAQVLNLLINLQKKYKLTYLFIAHNLSVVRFISDSVAIMYRGGIVERGPTEIVYKNPLHPYTKKLLASQPSLHKRNLSQNHKRYFNKPRTDISEDFSGCRFYQSCPQAKQRCKNSKPAFKQVSTEHWVSCFYID